MSRQEQELVWVEKELAEKHKAIFSDKGKIEERKKVFEEYLEKVQNSSRQEFKAQLAGLEEDAAMYTGLMLSVKKTFEKAKNEQLTASYELWEKFEAELPSTSQKVEKLIKALNPLVKKVEELNGVMAKLQTYNIDKVADSVTRLSAMTGKNKEMVEFLINHFDGTKPQKGHTNNE